MPRGTRPNSDRYWSDGHRKFLGAVAARVLANTGVDMPKDELINEAWYRCARHYEGPRFGGIWNFAYRAMLHYIDSIGQAVPSAAHKRGIRVREFPDDLQESYLDCLRIDDSSCDIFDNGDLCRYVLGDLSPRHAQVLRLLYIDGKDRVTVARRWKCSKWNVSLTERRALANARRVMERAKLLVG